MKHIRLKLLPLLAILISYTAKAQNDFYQNSDDSHFSNPTNSNLGISNDTPISIDQYQTESDYWDQQNGATNSRQTQNSSEYFDEETGNTYITNNYFDQDDYYDYQYASRIRRFHRNYYGFGYYDNCYTNYYWYNNDPFFYGSSIYASYGWWGWGNNWRWRNNNRWRNNWGWGNNWNYNNGWNNWRYPYYTNNSYYYNSYDRNSHYYGRRNSLSSHSTYGRRNNLGSINQPYKYNSTNPRFNRTFRDKYERSTKNGAVRPTRNTYQSSPRKTSPTRNTYQSSPRKTSPKNNSYTRPSRTQPRSNYNQNNARPRNKNINSRTKTPTKSYSRPSNTNRQSKSYQSRPSRSSGYSRSSGSSKSSGSRSSSSGSRSSGSSRNGSRR